MLFLKAIRKFTVGTFLKSIAKVASGNLLVSLISLVTSVMVARWTTPYDLGMWNSVLLISIYAPALQFGVFNGLNRQLPYFTGKGQRDTGLDMAAASYAWCLLLTGVSVIATAVVAIIFALLGNMRYCYTALAIGSIIACTWPTQYLTVTYRTGADFGRLAGRNTIAAILGIPLTLLVLSFGYVGLMARAVLIALFGMLALFFRRPVRVRPRFDKQILRQLGRIGLPIWMLGQLGAFFLTLDRLVLADAPVTLGYFSIAVQATTFASMIPTAITMVLYPQMVQKYGESHDATVVWALARTGGLVALALGTLAALTGWVMVPFFVERLLPAYQPGVEAAQWACLTGIAMAFSVFNNVFNVIQRQDIYLIGLGIGLAVFFTAWFALTRAMGQTEILAAVQSMLLANLAMAIASALLSKIVCTGHDKRRTLASASLDVR